MNVMNLRDNLPEGTVAAVVQSRAGLCTDEFYHQFVSDATEIVSGARGEPWWDLMQLADAAFDIEDVEDRIDTLERYADIAERALHVEGFSVNWDDGFAIHP
jgi:hypothetical protein